MSGPHTPASAQSLTTPTDGQGGLQKSESAGNIRRGSKLGINIPDAQAGERPYYHEAYHRYCQTTLQMREAVQVTAELATASNIYYNLTRQHAAFKKYKRGEREVGKFLWNDRMQTSLHTSIAQLQKAEVWEERTRQSRKLAEAILPVCEEAVFAGNRIFRNRAPIPKSLIALDSTTSFIAVDFGCMIHVWFSTSEAKTFIYSQQTVVEKLAELRIDSVFVPFSMMFLINCVTVTVTPLVPLPTLRRTLIESLQLRRIMLELDSYARTRTPLQLYHGADSRFYVLDCMPALHVDGENQGETSCLVRMILFDLFPNIDDYPHTLLRTSKNMLDTVVNDMIDAAAMFGDKVGGTNNLKIHDLITNRLVPKACHAHGFKIAYLYDAYTHKQLQGIGVASVLKETIVAEMVCRTLKEIVRAEIATVRLIPTPEADVAGVQAFLIELANRCVFNLLTKEELWAPHVLPVLRSKFRTPDSFVIPQIAVTKRSVLAYLNARLGLVFESGRFQRMLTQPVMTSLVRPCQATKLVLQSKQQDAHQQLLSNWKKVADIQDQLRQMCAMRHQVALFAIARSERLDWYVNIIQMKMDEFHYDDVARAVMNPLLVESLAELPDSTRAMTVFHETLKRDIPMYTKHTQDYNVAAERFRSMGNILASLDPYAEEEIGAIRVEGFKYLRKDAAAIDAVTSTRFVELYCDTLNYLFTVPNQYADILLILQWLQGAKMGRERMIYLGEELTKFSGRSLHVKYLASLEDRHACRDVATENFEIHAELYADTETPWQIALLLFCAHWGNCMKEELPKKQWADQERFRDAATKIQASLIAEQKGMLRGEWFVALTAPIATTLMDHTEWHKAHCLLAFGHHVLSDGKVDGNVKAGEPALPVLKEAAYTMKCAVKACRRLQMRQRRRQAIRESEKLRQIEARQKREVNSVNRANLCKQPMPPDELVTAAKYCAELAANPKSHATPGLSLWFTSSGETSQYRNKLHGLRVLLNVAPVRKTPRLCALLVYSGHFPPIRWAEVPHVRGLRYIVIVPDCQSIGAYWHKHWLAPARFGDTVVPLYVKVGAAFLFSQFRFTYLFFTVVGFGWAGPIAECLASLVPIEESQALITFGGPCVFQSAKAMSPMGHAHVVHEDDLVPRLIGAIRVPQLKARLLSKLDSLGAILPCPPTRRIMTHISNYQHYGSRMHRLSKVQDPVNPNAWLLKFVDYSADKQREDNIDLRGQYCSLSPLYYFTCMKVVRLNSVEALAAAAAAAELANAPPPTVQKDAKGKIILAQTAAPKQAAVVHWRPEQNKFLLAEVDPEGNPSDLLKDTITVPLGVEPNVSSIDLMALAYPRITSKIFGGLLQLTEDYGFSLDGSSNSQFVETIMKCRSTEILGNLLNSFVGASWNGDWIAQQLQEWSQVTQGLQRQPLCEPLVVSFVEKHAFLFTMCPETTKSSDSISVLDRLSKSMTDEEKKHFNTPEGYHVGWTLVLATTVSGVGADELLKALLNVQCGQNGISDTHPRTSKSMFLPALRFAWVPQKGVVSQTRGIISQQSAVSKGSAGNLKSPTGNRPDGDGFERKEEKAKKEVRIVEAGVGRQSKRDPDKGDTSGGKQGGADGATGGAATDDKIICQLNILAYLFDGSNAAQTILRGAAQVIWLIVDDFTFEHLQQTVDMNDPEAGENLSQMVVYLPFPIKGDRRTNFETATKVRKFCDLRHLLFCEVDLTKPDTLTALLCLLVGDISPGVRVPLNQFALPSRVNVGAMYTVDSEEITRQQKKVQATLIKPDPEPEMTEKQKKLLEKKTSLVFKKGGAGGETPPAQASLEAPSAGPGGAATPASLALDDGAKPKGPPTKADVDFGPRKTSITVEMRKTAPDGKPKPKTPTPLPPVRDAQPPAPALSSRPMAELAPADAEKLARGLGKLPPKDGNKKK